MVFLKPFLNYIVTYADRFYLPENSLLVQNGELWFIKAHIEGYVSLFCTSSIL